MLIFPSNQIFLTEIKNNWSVSKNLLRCLHRVKFHSSRIITTWLAKASNFKKMKSYRLVFLLCFGAVTALKLQCKFENVDFDQNYYICEVDNPRVDSTRTNVTGIDGEHFEGRTNQNVNCFKAHRSSLLRAMPSGLENFFHNLTMISIRNTRLKAITQESLKPFSELTVLDLMMNKLRVLESGLFKFNTKLKEIYFNDNHLNAIAPDIFEPLGDLELAYFSGNLCINIGTDYTGHSLDDVKKKIVDDCQNEPKMQVDYFVLMKSLSNFFQRSHLFV